MIAETTQRQVVIFTGRGVSISTIESIETLSEAYPRWHFTVLHEHKTRKWGPYLRSKLHRLKREPISYPAELIGQGLSQVRFRSRRRRKRSIEMPSSYEQIGANLKSVESQIEEVQAIEDRAERRDPDQLNRELNARSGLANSRTQLLESLLRYNFAITGLERAKGTLLEFNNVVIVDSLSEE